MLNEKYPISISLKCCHVSKLLIFKSFFINSICRTVKTLVHTLVKMKGASITNHLTQIPDVNESDLFPYLHKVLKVIHY